VQTALKHYRTDYVAFDMPVPNWAAALAGSEFLENLGLRAACLPSTKTNGLRNSIQRHNKGRSKFQPQDVATPGRAKSFSYSVAESQGLPKFQLEASRGRANKNSAVQAAASADDDDQAVEKVREILSVARRKPCFDIIV